MKKHINRYCFGLLAVLLALVLAFPAEAQSRRNKSRRKQNKSVSNFKGNVKKKKQGMDFDVFAGRSKNRSQGSAPCPEFKKTANSGVAGEEKKKETVYIKPTPTQQATSGTPDSATSSSVVVQNTVPQTTGTHQSIPTDKKARIEQLLKERNGYMNPLYFVFDKDELTAEDRQTLNTAADYAREGYRIIVEGHTDDKGKASYNDELSQRRAERIRGLLISEMGLSPKQVEVKSMGESAPVVPNRDAGSRQLNRRVEIRLSRNQ
jgi:outer membrane protein OmpA-like peptidoglycan-associated protein